MIKYTPKMEYKRITRDENIYFDKTTINGEDFPEIMWKKTSTRQSLKGKVISITILVSISTSDLEIDEEALLTWNEICRTRHY
jgi:hypothetical protein